MALRVAFSGYFLDRPHTGSGQYSRQLLRHLARIAPHNLLVVCPSQATFDAGARLQRELDEGARERISLVPAAPPSFLGRALGKVWFEQVALPRTAARLGADLLHVPYFGPPLAAPCPVVATIHDLIPLLVPQNRGAATLRLYTELARRASRRVRLALADSHATQRDLVRHIPLPEERTRVVWLAADPSLSPEPRPEDARIRQGYELSEGYVLYLGNLEYRKNVATLVRAFARLPGEPLLVLAGEAPARPSALFPDVDAVVRERGVTKRVRRLGRVPAEHQGALYRGAAVFAFPSLYEGFGLTPLEAMTCGTPVVSSRATSLAEVVDDGGVLIDPQDEEALASWLARILAEPSQREELRRRALSRAALFRWDKTARETAVAYEAAVASQTEPASSAARHKEP